MATIKAVLRKKQNADGSYPIAIRITKNRKPAYIYIGHSVQAHEWDSVSQAVVKSHPNAARLNNFILAKKAEASNKTLEAETKDESVSVKAIKNTIKPKGDKTFFARAADYLKGLKDTGRYNSYNAEKPRIKQFKEFLGGSDIAFSDISVGLLRRFDIHLKSTRNVSERTIINHMIVIRTIFNKAVDDGVATKDNYPFGKGKISIKFPSGTKIGISRDDVAKLEQVHLDNQNHHHARNLWLISYYFAGARISDVLRLRWSDFKDLRLHYTMGKNNKSGSLKVVEKAITILDEYRQQKENANDLIFPDLKILPNLDDDFEVQRAIALADNKYNKMLRKFVAPKAKIEGKLTMHIARHTFATFAGDTIPTQMLQKLYRHSDIRTTIGYQANFINKESDDALCAVIGSI